MKACKVAICEWSLPIKGPAMFPVVQELGLDGIQIDDWSSWEHNYPMADQKIQNLYLTAARETGIAIPSMGCNGFSRLGGFVNRLGTSEGDKSVEALLKTKDICERMEIPLAMFPCCWSGSIRNTADLENMAEMLRKVCHFYDGSPVNIAIESLLTPRQYRDLFVYVGSKSLKIYYDTQNTQYFGYCYPPEELREIDIADIAEIHFKDGIKTAQGSTLYGNGDTGFKETVEVLKAKGYDGWCVIENFYMKPTWQEPDGDVYSWIAEDARRIKQSFLAGN